MPYTIRPEEDPTAFYEPQDETHYHLCDLPGHKCYVPFPFADCMDPGVWTWGEKFRWGLTTDDKSSSNDAGPDRPGPEEKEKHVR